MTHQEKAARRVIEMFRELPENYRKAVIDKIKFDGIMQAAAEVSKTNTVCFGDLYPEVQERQKYFNKFEGFRSGLKYFDDALMGLRGGELVIIAGPSNFGKTTVALNLAVNTVIQSQKTCLIISMEMTTIEIGSRIYNMSDNHDPLMERIIVQTELSVNTRHIEAMIQRHQPDFVVLDHLQFLANQETGQEYERISSAVAKIKRLAIIHNIPIIAVSHVAKTRSGKNGEASSSDLKGSSSIEQDCDVGFMINRATENISGNEIILTNFKHRTKRPEVFHKPCIVKFDGIRIADGGRYAVKDWRDL